MDWDSRKLRELIELVKATGLRDDPFVLKILDKYSQMPNDHLYEKVWGYCIENNRISLLDNVFPKPTSREELEEVNGEFRIGTIADTDIGFGITRLHLNQHLTIFGKPGTGKTTIIKILSPQVIRDGQIKIWIIDPKSARDFRFLVHLLLIS